MKDAVRGAIFQRSATVETLSECVVVFLFVSAHASRWRLFRCL